MLLGCNLDSMGLVKLLLSISVLLGFSGILGNAKEVRCVPRDVLTSSAPPIIIPEAWINDDYCDCMDGSDEPLGSAACVDAPFTCQNKKHTSTQIPSAHVRDGACDCCDGSDEEPGVCPDICEEEGRVARLEAQKVLDAMRRGRAARKKLADEGLKMMDADRRKLEELKISLAGLGKKGARAVALSDELRRARDISVQESALDEEAQAMDEPDAANIESEPAEPAPEVDWDDSSEGLDQRDYDHEEDVDGEPEYHHDELEDTVSDLGEESGRLDGEGNAQTQERAASNGQTGRPGADGDVDSAMPGEPAVVNESATPRDEDMLCAELSRAGSNKMLSSIHFYRALVLKKINRFLPKALRKTLFKTYQKGSITDCFDKAEESRKAIDREKADMEDKIRGLESKVGRDYGTDMALRALDGVCVRQTFTQYEYELCFFDKVRQFENGAAIATLGQWGSWSGGRAGDGAMQYEKGDQCWNGPKRSTSVRLECGEANHMVSVDEPNRCAYEMRLRTPAACAKADAHNTKSAGDRAPGSPHDEL